jgi:hypothetical protein
MPPIRPAATASCGDSPKTRTVPVSEMLTLRSMSMVVDLHRLDLRQLPFRDDLGISGAMAPRNPEIIEGLGGQQIKLSG